MSESSPPRNYIHGTFKEANMLHGRRRVSWESRRGSWPPGMRSPVSLNFVFAVHSDETVAITSFSGIEKYSRRSSIPICLGATMAAPTLRKPSTPQFFSVNRVSCSDSAS